MTSAKIVVGLGNPGKAYEHTPHNIGFKVVDELADRCGCVLRRSFRFKARLGKTMIAAKETWLMKPGAYVNNSGQVVAAVLRKRGLPIQDLIVVLDDADLGPGQLRIRTKGSDGGHKGLKSIIERVGTEDFIRVRLGIGRSEHNADLVKHVLTPLSPKAREEMKATTRRAADAVLAIIEQGAEAAMNQFNARGNGRGS